MNAPVTRGPAQPMGVRSPLTNLWAVALSLCLALCLGGCGSETGSSGGADAGGDAGAASADAGAAGFYPEGSDKCQNTADLGWLKEDQGKGETGRDVARAAAGDCGLGCLNHPAPDQCAIKCMLEDKGVKLSDACAGCYGGIVLCTINRCLPKCIDDAQSKGCKDCQEEKGCNTPFYACTGNLD